MLALRFYTPIWFLTLILFAIANIEEQPNKHKHTSEPLSRGHRVRENDYWAKDGEELPCGGDNGAHQRAEGCDCDEDERLFMGWQKEEFNQLNNEL